MPRTNAASNDPLPDLSPQDTTRLTLLLALNEDLHALAAHTGEHYLTLLRWLTSAPIRAYLEAHDAAATRATRAATTPDLALARDALLRSLEDAETPNQLRLAATALARLPAAPRPASLSPPSASHHTKLSSATATNPTASSDTASPLDAAPRHPLPITQDSPAAALISRAGTATTNLAAPQFLPSKQLAHPPPLRKSA